MKKAILPASSVGSVPQNNSFESLPGHRVEDCEAVAKLITPNPPEWLAGHLMSWSPTIFLSLAVEKRQPTRTEMKRILDRIIASAALLQRAFSEPSVCEFLNSGGDGPMDSPVKFKWVIREVQHRAIGASKLPTLVDSKGNAKAGKSRALPDGAISAQTYCSLLIAETWKWFRGEYPPPRNRQAAEAVDLYWKLAGGAKQSWGSDPLSSWRYHLDKILKIPAEKERAEYRRHLRESEHAAALLRSDPPKAGN